jgi:hypothetical protein
MSHVQVARNRAEFQMAIARATQNDRMNELAIFLRCHPFLSMKHMRIDDGTKKRNKKRKDEEVI